MPVVRIVLLASLLVFVLYGREAVDAFAPETQSGLSQSLELGRGGGDIGSAARMLGKHAANMAEASTAMKDLAEPEHAAEVAGNRYHELLDAYEAQRLVLAIGLVGVPLVWTLLAFGSAFASFAFVARKLGEGAHALARGWLGVLSTAAPLLTLATGDLVWPTLPAEWLIVPALWLVASASAQRVVDENAPVWNTTLNALLGVVAGMVASLALQHLDLMGRNAVDPW